MKLIILKKLKSNETNYKWEIRVDVVIKKHKSKKQNKKNICTWDGV